MSGQVCLSQINVPSAKALGTQLIMFGRPGCSPHTTCYDVKSVYQADLEKDTRDVVASEEANVGLADSATDRAGEGGQAEYVVRR